MKLALFGLACMAIGAGLGHANAVHRSMRHWLRVMNWNHGRQQ